MGWTLRDRRGGLESSVLGLRWWGDDRGVLPGCCVGGVTSVLARASEKGVHVGYM